MGQSPGQGARCLAPRPSPEALKEAVAVAHCLRGPGSTGIIGRGSPQDPAARADR